MKLFSKPLCNLFRIWLFSYFASTTDSAIILWILSNGSFIVQMGCSGSVMCAWLTHYIPHVLFGYLLLIRHFVPNECSFTECVWTLLFCPYPQLLLPHPPLPSSILTFVQVFLHLCIGTFSPLKNAQQHKNRYLSLGKMEGCILGEGENINFHLFVF